MISQEYDMRAAEDTSPYQSDRQEMADLILQRSEWLEPADRALIEQVFGRGGSPRELAAILHVSPRTVQRRIHSLVARLTDPKVLIVLRRHSRWDAKLASIALAHWVRRRPMQQIAADRQLTMFEVRQQIQFVRGLIAGELERQRCAISE